MSLTELDAALADLSEAELLSLPTVRNWVERNQGQFKVDALPDEFIEDINFEHWRVLVTYRGEGQWGVRDLSQDHIVMRDGTWRSIPIPTAEVPNARYTLAEAIIAARAASAKITGVNDMSLTDYIAWLRKRYAAAKITAPALSPASGR